MKKIIVILLTAFVFATNAFSGLTVSPARSEVVMEKNNVFNGSYIIGNDYDQTINVEISAKNWNNSLENKDVNVEEWLSVSLKSFSLVPGEKREIFYTVKSENFKGSLSGMISFTIQAPGSESINLMTSVPVYLTVEGTQRNEFSIEKLEVVNRRINPEVEQKDNKDINIVYTVKNSGNVFLRLIGSLQITKGKKVIVDRVIPEQSPVYPDTSRAFYETISRLRKGKYVAKIVLNGRGVKSEKSVQFRVNKYGDASF